MLIGIFFFNRKNFSKDQTDSPLVKKKSEAAKKSKKEKKTEKEESSDEGECYVVVGPYIH